YNEQRHGYYYTKPVSEFPFLETTAEDIVSVIVAQNALRHLQGSSLEASIRSGFEKILSSMGGQVSLQWTDIDKAFAVQSKGMAEQDLQLIRRLTDALLECREVEFQYKKLRANSAELRKVRPYHLTEIDGAWYIIGYDLDRKARRTFNVQRITNLGVTSRRFPRPADLNLESHLSGSFGVWSGTKKEGEEFEVKIKFTDFAARIVSERRWHPSQELEIIDEHGNEIELTMRLTALEDVSRWVMGFGPMAEVLGPPEFREMMRDQHAAALRQYQALE
ncbi:MAG: WYL domain-containing protein, partial [Verrucomicrobiota bacterium]